MDPLLGWVGDLTAGAGVQRWREMSWAEKLSQKLVVPGS